MNVADRKAQEAKANEIGEKIGRTIGTFIGRYGLIAAVVYFAAKRGTKAGLR